MGMTGWRVCKSGRAWRVDLDWRVSCACMPGTVRACCSWCEEKMAKLVCYCVEGDMKGHTCMGCWNEGRNQAGEGPGELVLRRVKGQRAWVVGLGRSCWRWASTGAVVVGPAKVGFNETGLVWGKKEEAQWATSLGFEPNKEYQKWNTINIKIKYDK